MHLEGRKEERKRERRKEKREADRRKEGGKKELAVIYNSLYNHPVLVAKASYISMGNLTGDYKTQETRHKFCRKSL